MARSAMVLGPSPSAEQLIGRLYRANRLCGAAEGPSGRWLSAMGARRTDDANRPGPVSGKSLVEEAYLVEVDGNTHRNEVFSSCSGSCPVKRF